MTVRKKDNLLRGDRTPAYVGRETGAAELQISPDTWDQWVKEGRLPRPCEAFPPGTPRWRWEDVDRRLSGSKETTFDPLQWAETVGTTRGGTTDLLMRGALNFGKKPPPKKKIGRPRTVTVPAPPRVR